MVTSYICNLNKDFFCCDSKTFGMRNLELVLLAILLYVYPVIYCLQSHPEDDAKNTLSLLTSYSCFVTLELLPSRVYSTNLCSLNSCVPHML